MPKRKKRRKQSSRDISLPEATLPENKKITFSFEYYDTSCDDYCLSGFTKEQVKKSITRLQDISSKTFNEMQRCRNVYHFYEVIWEQTTKKKGFPNPKANELSAFHFALLGVNQQLARVYGAYSSGVFYLVWFDLNHEIWPTALKHT